jgi:FtsZ-interacting cell division protein ZipA
MSTKVKVIIAVIVLAVTFATGRWSASQKTTKTTEQVTQTDVKADVKDTHTKTTITETKQPTGVDTTVTVIDQVQDDKSTENDNTKTQIQQTVTPTSKSKLNISVLGAEDFSKGFTEPTYGLSISKEVLGPLTVGAFGLMNGTVGISVGLDF